MNRRLILAILLFGVFILVNFVACCPYSFTGASVPQHLKTIFIPIADDKSGAAEPGLREALTEKLIQKFIDDNTLQVAERVNANALLECTIISLTDAPAIVSAGENITSRRITVGVKVVYRDLVQKKTVFDRSFSNYADYPPGGDIGQRSSAIEQAIENITEDILLETVSGW